MASKNIEANYLSIQNGIFKATTINIDDIFGIEVNNEDLYFAFESQLSPKRRFDAIIFNSPELFL